VGIEAADVAAGDAGPDVADLALTVDSMFTTTPFFRPRDGALPMPITSKPPSGFISATMAAIFEVPMSRPTIRFLLSFLPLNAIASTYPSHQVFFGPHFIPGDFTAKPLL
jgi:hypothetical protein